MLNSDALSSPQVSSTASPNRLSNYYYYGEVGFTVNAKNDDDTVLTDRKKKYSNDSETKKMCFLNSSPESNHKKRLKFLSSTRKLFKSSSKYGIFL